MERISINWKHRRLRKNWSNYKWIEWEGKEPREISEILKTSQMCPEMNINTTKYKVGE